MGISEVADITAEMAETPLGTRVAGQLVAGLAETPLPAKLVAQAQDALSSLSGAARPTRDFLNAQQKLEFENTLATKEITYNTRASDFVTNRVKTGYIEQDSGTLAHVIVREKPADPVYAEVFMNRVQRELKAYAIQKRWPFTVYFPVTVWRPGENILVQERFGNNLGHRMALLDARANGSNTLNSLPFYHINNLLDLDLAKSPSFTRLMRDDPKFRDQDEQTVAVRSLFGDNDGSPFNTGLSKLQGKLKMAVIDVERSFGSDPEPPIMSDQPYYWDRPFSKATAAKIGEYVREFGAPEGRRFLSGLRMSQTDIDAMLSRGKWLLDHGHFAGPKSLGLEL